MIKLKILSSYYKVIDEYSISESSREVKFSNLKIDFTDKTIADLPLKYQEVQLVDVDNNYNINEIIYTGYVNNFILPNMKNGHEYRELEIDLLSPLAMATIRTVDAVGTYNLQPLIREIIQPLIDDGFVLKEFNIGNNQITVNYLMETVESALNKLSNKHNFWWFIDKNKNIYINSISYLLAKKPVFEYNNENEINGLTDLIPSIDATDYCNTVDFINVRLYVQSYYQKYYDIDPYTEEDIEKYEYFYPLMNKKTLENGDEIEFNIPIDTNPVNVVKAYNEKGKGAFVGKEVLSITKVENKYNHINVLRIYVNDNNELVIPNNVSIEDSYSDSKEWVLVRDVFFKNLIVGLKYNGTSINVGEVSSTSALTWAKVRFYDNIEINKNKGIINNTGIVEKQINMDEQWKTYSELTTIANSYIKNNETKVETVVLNIDEKNNFEIGDTIKIDKQEFLINDTFIITDKKARFYNNEEEWSFTLKNTNILESYIDLFRATESEESANKEINLITADYFEEGFQESYEVNEL